MSRPGSLAFAGSAVFFAIFTANVMSGAFGSGAYLRDLFEMLALLLAVICFVVGILAREALRRRSRE